MPTRFLDAAASLLLGAVCPGCGTPCAQLCPACAAVLAAPEPFRPAAGPALGGTAAPGAVPLVAAAPYDDRWRRCIVAYKERTGWWLGAPLGRALALSVGEAVALARAPVAEGLALVPMPSQAHSVRERGQDTTLVLARVAARVLAASGLATRVHPVLRHARRVADQSTLGEADRLTNVVEALAARPAGPGLVVVVDDLTTTGASLAEACRALEEAGTPASACATVAATPRRDGRHG